MKRTIALFLGVVLMVTMCSCSSKGKSKEIYGGFITREEDEERNSNNSNERTKMKERQYVSLHEGSNFSEGIAWVTYNDPNTGERKKGLLKTDGEILSNDYLSNLNSGDYCSKFSMGYSYINHFDYSDRTRNSFTIIDGDGNIISTSPKDGTGYQILAGGDGIYYVHQQVLNMTENENLYGFIKADGSWIIKPTRENPLKYGLASKEAQAGAQLKYYYLGEHVFAVVVDDFFDCLAIYNVDTGASCFYDNAECLDAYGSKGDTSQIVLTNHYTDEPFMFSNGLSMVILHDTICSLNTRCEIKELIKIPHGFDGTQVVYHDGIFLYGSVKFNRTWEMHDGAFYDLRGNVIADVSKYNLAVYGDTYGFYEYCDGLAAIKVVGADGKYYVVHIDTSGKPNYEPIAIYSLSGMLGHGNAAGNAMYIKKLDDKGQSNYVLHSDGETQKIDNSVNVWTGSEKGERTFIFACGFAWCEQNLVYIGEDGHVLDTYILSNVQ